MAVTPFIKRGSKNVWCIVDNHSKYTNGWAREISVNLSDHMIFKIDLFGYDIYIGDDEDELLKSVSSEYEYAIVIASGTSFTLSDKLFPLIENLCKQDFFIAGHVLDRGADYPELHHQFYIINLPEYKSAAYPIIGAGKEFNSLDMPWHGHNIMRIAGNRVIDIGTEIRNAKRYLYYEHEHVFLKELSNIYHDQFFANNFFAAWNSDKLYNSISFTGPVDQYVTVGIGLNWIKNLEIVGFTKDSTVIFTDINHNCLVYMKKLIETWDGVNYSQFYKNNSPMGVNGESPIPESYYDKTDSEWKEFISTFDDWSSIWNQVRQLKFKYILTNYMSNYNFDWIEPGKRTLINLSDLFTHTPYVFVHSLKYRIASENKLFRILVDKDPEVTLMLTSRAVNGFTDNNEYIGNRLIVGKVKDFELSNIKDLRCPPWHRNDW